MTWRQYLWGYYRLVEKVDAEIGRVLDALDIPVTILDIIDVEKPSTMHGVSLQPILKGKSIPERKFVVAETMFARGERNLGATGRMLRTRQYKYIIYDNGQKREQLFDMEKNFGEMNNLANNEKFKKELNRHRELLTQWAGETADAAFPYIHPD